MSKTEESKNKAQRRANIRDAKLKASMGEHKRKKGRKEDRTQYMHKTKYMKQEKQRRRARESDGEQQRAKKIKQAMKIHFLEIL